MRKNLDLIYKKLYSRFGSQHWWPADAPFEVIVGAILTQNTSWFNVEKAINNLKENKLLEPDKLYRLPYKRLALLIRQVGYYNIKARRLKEFLNFFFRVYRGSLRKMSLTAAWDLRRQLLSINGIGPETADSILLYALNKPVFVIDAYTRRILSRHHIIKIDASYAETQNLFMRNLKPDVNPVRNIKTIRRKDKISNVVNHVKNTKSPRKKNKISNVVKLFNEYHALLVRLGKEFCLKDKPKCEICPLREKSK